MVGGSDADSERVRHRRRPWGWGLFLVAVLALKLGALGSEPPVAGAADGDGSDAGAFQDGDPVATTRLAWVLSDAAGLGAPDAARTCIESGPACDPDGMLAVDTSRARAGSLAGALTAATDPAHAGYLGEPSGAMAERATEVRAAAEQTEEALGRWLVAGCGSTVDGIPVEVRPPDCADLGEAASSALRALAVSLEGRGR